MTTAVAAPAIFQWKTRPCIVTGERVQERPKIGGKFRGTYVALLVRFLDGNDPPLGQFGKVTWGKQAKLLKGAQALVWRRVDELRQDGLTAADAKRQAMAELAKGVLGSGE